MDPLRLLSRSTKLSKLAKSPKQYQTPSSGESLRPQLFHVENELKGGSNKKRKREEDVVNGSAELDFFGTHAAKSSRVTEPGKTRPAEVDEIDDNDDHTSQVPDAHALPIESRTLVLDERRNLLQKNKVKVTWLNPARPQKKDRRKEKDRKLRGEKAEKDGKVLLFPQPLQSFKELRTRYGIAGKLAANIDDQGYSLPTEVQLCAMPLLLDEPSNVLSSGVVSNRATVASKIDLLTVAPTGSGKTLAFMIPLVHEIICARRASKKALKQISAIILVPTKELAGQIVNEGRKLTRETGVRVTQVRKGMVVAQQADEKEADHQKEIARPRPSPESIVKSDVLVSTPGVLASILQETKEQQGSAALSEVRHLILDEADVLLDPLFREQTLAIWDSLHQPDLRVSLWSATMGSSIEELARAKIQNRHARLAGSSKQSVEEAPVLRLVVGLKDSAVPNVRHQLIYAASEPGKLMGLRQLLHPAASSTDSAEPLLPPFLVFAQTIERAVALHAELLYDIPAEAGGIARIAVLHSNLSDSARENVMAKFRKGEIWILITTDLLSRGVDFRGVNGVINYDIPTSSAAYVHRIGRTGRAGRDGGVAVTLYSKEDIPFLKPIANLVAAAQARKGGSPTDDHPMGAHAWLLDALPRLSKKAKRDFKKRGVESRTTRASEKSPAAARRARISTKSGFVRQEENKRKGAIRGSRQREQAPSVAGEEVESDFVGFD